MDVLKPPAEKLLVCVGPSTFSANLINSAKKIATSLNAKWFAVCVETPKMLILPEAERNRAADNLRLAEQLGAETFTLTGRDIAEELIDFARQQNITKIVAGKPRGSRWKSIFSRSPVDKLVRIGGKVDVYIITGESGEQRVPTYVIRPKRIPFSDYGTALLFFILATGLCFLMFHHFDLSNLIMIYLLGVMLTATCCGRWPAILISLLSVLAFDFFFVPPRFSFTVAEAQYIVTFIVMFLVAFVISHLSAMMRRQAEVARLQERQAAAMHGLSRQLASTRGMEKILGIAVQYISEIFDCQVLALQSDEKGKLNVTAGDLFSVLSKDIIKEINIARLAYDTGQMAGWGTQNSPATEILYVPLQVANSTLGILALRPADPKRFLLSEQLNLLESLAKQVALALEVELLAGSRVSH